MKSFDYHKPTSLPRRPRLGVSHEKHDPIAGGMTLLPTMKQRLAAPAGPGRPGELPGLQAASPRRGRLVTIGAHDAPCRRCRVVRRAAASRRLRRLPRHRRSAGAQSRHHRRLDRQQRPGGRLSGGAGRARRPVVTNRREIAADAFFLGMFETALEPGEMITAVGFPLAAPPAMRSSQSRRRAMRWSASSSRVAAVSGSRSPALGPACSGVPAIESRPGRRFEPSALDAVA